jgi:integrase
MLTDTTIKKAKPKAKPYKLHDERGLYLIVTPTGSKWWRFKYVFGSKLATTGKRKGKPVSVEKGMSLGLYPDVPLKSARDKRDDARRLVAAGIDPSAKRQSERNAVADSFKAVAEEVLSKQAKHLSEETIHNKRTRLETWVYPTIGNKPINQLTTNDLYTLLKRVESTERYETARRVRQAMGQVFGEAVRSGRVEKNPVRDLQEKGTIRSAEHVHHAGLKEPDKVGALLRAIDGYRGQPLTELALRLTPLVFVRPGELRAAEWAEIGDLDAAEPLWRIPGRRMKGGRDFLVPLSRQAVAILRQALTHSAGYRYVFSTGPKAMSENTIGGALRALGYDNTVQVPHGFRTTASTLLNELNFNRDVIELQLAHHEKNEVRDSYNRAERLPDRRTMMQAWADYLDEVRALPGASASSKTKRQVSVSND